MIKKRHLRNGTAAFALAGLAALPATAISGDVILQYFEGKWETMERRMPDIFMAHYDSIWVPPPGIADSGGFSVGYDVYDRFNFGNGYSPTLYGTTQGFSRLSKEMDRAGILLYVDAVLNHNGFRDVSSPGFADAGDYPGFVVTLPNDIDGDFHGIFEGGDLNSRLAGLIDIAQEKNYLFVRHPVPGFNNLIPNETPLESNRRFYPDRDLPQEDGRYPYNLANPLAGDPVEENATGLLNRYLQWMVEVHGVDGFRLDATKHIPTWFFNNFYDATLYNLGTNPIDGSPFTPFSFGENFEGDFGRLAAYVRKDGYGNRDTKDFPLYFTMRDVFDAGGFGDMRRLEYASFDGYDGNANDGSLGVLFAGSHDSFSGGFFNGFGNLPYAHILTRTGLPIVYYNAREFGDGRDFPKDGRGDALGNFGPTLTRLMEINKEYVRNNHITRWIDEDVYLYERNLQIIVGINDRGDGGFDQRQIQTSFAEGTKLVELTGNATDAFVDPSDDIFDEITVGANGVATVRVPRNTSADDDFHGRGYVIYGPPAPQSTLAITNSSSTIGPDPDDGRPQGTRRLTPLHVVTADTIDVELTVNASSDAPNDAAMIKVNFGELDIDGDGNRNASGEFAGFESFPEAGRPTNGIDETRVYTASIDATSLMEGYTYIETVSFRQRPGDTPPIFDNERSVVYLDRLPPEQDLLFPEQTGNGDITSADYEAVISTDHTVNSVHVLTNIDPGASDQDIIALVSGDNAARKHDRLEYRYVLRNVPNGTLELTVVAFEETGNYSIERYGNIDVELALPPVFLGVDTNTDPGGVDFQSVPGFINNAAYPNEFVIRVQTQNIDGQGRDIIFPADFTVSLQVDENTPIEASSYDAGLLPPVGLLVQNDQNIGDQFDEFRFLWRGYTPGTHTFRAVALLNGEPEPNEAFTTIEVAADTPGPSVTITTPAPPGETINDPTTIVVEGTFDDDLAEFAQIFLDLDAGPRLLATINDPQQGAFRIEKPVDSYALSDVLAPDAISIFGGEFPVRVIAATSPTGGGISTETQSAYTVTGVPTLPQLPPINVDGDASDLLAAPVLTVSPADGGTGDADPQDFGDDGTLTELRALIRGNTLYAAVRGDMFDSPDEGPANASFLFIEANSGSSQGTTDPLAQLQDFSDGLRGQISSVPLLLSSALLTEGNAFDLIVGITDPDTGYGYTVGSDGTTGSFSEMEYQGGVFVAYDGDASADPAAPGTTIAGPNAFEVAIPFAALGTPNPRKIRFAAMTTSDEGYGSPNTLPENSGNAFGTAPNAQTFEELAMLPDYGTVLLNEISVGDSDLIELYNPGASSIDLEGWALRLYDSAGVSTDFIFPQGTAISAGGYLVLSDGTSPEPPKRQDNLYTGFNIPWDQSRGGAAALIDPVGLGIDYVAWRNAANDSLTDTGALPYGTAFADTIAGPQSGTAGHSLARDANSTDTGTAADWESTSGADSDGPTFGSQNTGGTIDGSTTWYLF